MRDIEKKKYSTLPITFSITNTVKTKDTRFLNVTIDVLHTGLNYNGSIFNKDVVDANLESMKNTPILGYIKLNEGTGNPDDFAAHEYKIIKDDNGTYKYVYSGCAFGVISESCNPRWITKISSDGKVREYLQVDGLLWTKFDKAIDIFKRDIVKGQSMELDEDSMRGVENSDGTFTFTGFKFDGCCILSTTDDSIQPAMIDSNVTANFSISVAQEIKNKLNEYQTAINFKNKNFSVNKEDEKRLDKEKQSLLDKYSLTIDKIDFNIDDLSIEDLDIKLKEYTEKQNLKSTFSATYNQKRDALRNALDGEIIYDDDGNLVSETSYWVQDFDDTYVYVEKDVWTTDNFEETYGRFTYSFDGKTIIATITGKWEEIFLMRLTADERASIEKVRGDYSKLEKEFNNYKNIYKTAETEVETLRTFKSEKLATERKNNIDAIFASNDFKVLENNKDFKNLKENVGELSLEDIETKCYAILGKHNARINFTTNNPTKSAVVLRVDNTSAELDDEPYGGLFQKYKNK